MYEDKIRDYIAHEIETIRSMDVSAIDEAMRLMRETYECEGSIYIFGNGGSSATASHYQNDFDKKFRFVCLNDNVPTLMAIANDIGFEEVFRFQLKNKLKQDDIVIAISGSGNSQNVVNAVTYAKSQGVNIIGLTGVDGGKLMKLRDVSLHVPINSMQITEDLHMMLDHLMMAVFYDVLCGKQHINK